MEHPTSAYARITESETRSAGARRCWRSPSFSAWRCAPTTRPTRSTRSTYPPPDARAQRLRPLRRADGRPAVARPRAWGPITCSCRWPCSTSGCWRDGRSPIRCCGGSAGCCRCVGLSTLASMAHRQLVAGTGDRAGRISGRGRTRAAGNALRQRRGLHPDDQPAGRRTAAVDRIHVAATVAARVLAAPGSALARVRLQAARRLGRQEPSARRGPIWTREQRRDDEDEMPPPIRIRGKPTAQTEAKEEVDER